MRDLYKDLTRRLQSLITDLLEGEGLEVIQIEARTKDVDSFIEKISRKGTKYKDPLAEITDLVGIRIITYYLEDVGRVGDILKGEFEIDEANSVDKSGALDPDQFGYASVHYIVGLSADRPLDEASVAAYIDDSGKREPIEKMIRAGGGTVVPSTRLARDRSDLLRTVRWAEIGTIEELDRYLATEILTVSLAGTAFFDRYDSSVEDALTTLILADKQAGEDTYSRIYADKYADFAPKIATWQARKRPR